MPLEKRKCHIEFISHNFVRLTNILYQKEYNLTEECCIDLKTLKKISMASSSKNKKSNPQSPFYVFFSKRSDENGYTGTILFQEGKDILSTVPGVANIKNEEITFSASVYVEE